MERRDRAEDDTNGKNIAGLRQRYYNLIRKVAEDYKRTYLSLSLHLI